MPRERCMVFCRTDFLTIVRENVSKYFVQTVCVGSSHQGRDYAASLFPALLSEQDMKIIYDIEKSSEVRFNNY